ncbi:hypothetical protein ACFLUM_02255 [Chloroflexota bacterium]
MGVFTVRPDTLLSWHRDLFCYYWQHMVWSFLEKVDTKISEPKEKSRCRLVKKDKRTPKGTAFRVHWQPGWTRMDIKADTISAKMDTNGHRCSCMSSLRAGDARALA